LEREIIQTLDGSTTIHLKEWDECYHSKHGAIQEAQHVFIQNGLSLFPNQTVAILEIGFGTGLNAFITFLESQKLNQSITYVGVEAYPVNASEVLAMNYVDELNAIQQQIVFDQMHESKWNEQFELSTHFKLTKRKQFFDEIDDFEQFDLIYFDAFGYRVQPELWSTAIFKKMYDALKPGGKLVTYAARGVVKRSMIEVGFTVEKLPGPPGKREMFRASKGK
jgi:tRNA U34 5-methylaminomethyl-2-thiouridine-forming methyltransferase MnmC